jgi:glutaconate CoA-transferase subunit A
VLHLPALEVDVALIHAERADRDGNLRLFAPYLDTVLAASAKRVIASVEQVVARESLSGWGSAGIPSVQVDVIVEAPLGAHPTGCYPDYAPDYEYLLDYAEAAGAGGEALRAGFVTPNERAYRTSLPVARVLELRALAASGGSL